MKTAKVCLTTTLVIGVCLAGCQQKVVQKSKPAVFRLFDLFEPEDLTGAVTADDAGWPHLEWNAQSIAAAAPADTSLTNHPEAVPPLNPTLTYRPVQNISGLKIDQGNLVGDFTGAAPVLDFATTPNRGGADSVKFIEVRMSVSGAKHVWLRPEGRATVDDQALSQWAAQTNEWKSTADVAEGKVQTYRFEIQPNPAPPAGAGPAGGGGPPPTAQPVAAAGAPATGPTNVVAQGAPATPQPAAPTGPPPGPEPKKGDLRHFSLAFREGSSGKFAIESVRFISDKEEKLKDPSGQQWAGLGEIYRASLTEKTPETIRIPVRELPEQPFLELAIGTPEDAPIKFKVSVSKRDGSKDAAPAVLFERTVTIPNRWQTARIDLANYAGKSVQLELTLSGEKKGLWGYWGALELARKLVSKPNANREASFFW